MLSIEIYKNNSTKEIEDFLSKHKNGSFFQSKLWGDFNKEYFNKEYYFVAVKNENKIKLATLILKNKLFLNYTYLYCPAGPVFDFEDDGIFNFFMKKIKKEIGSGVIFLRVDPRINYLELDNNIIEANNIIKNFFLKEQKFKISKDQKQPENTLKINLEKSKIEHDILMQMKEKGRYNIKVAEKNNITVKKTTLNGIELDNFYNLMLETTKRDGFFANDKDYYSKLLSINEKNSNYINNVCLYSAYYNDKIIASAINVFYGDTATYYYGSSTSEENYRKMMAPYMLQWEMIKDAKKMNYKYYDFLGIAPNINEINSKFYIFNGLEKKEFTDKDSAENYLKNHKFYGITQFKTRFGGDIIKYPGAIDKIYNMKIYYIIDILKSIRKMIRKIIKIRV